MVLGITIPGTTVTITMATITTTTTTSLLRRHRSDRLKAELRPARLGRPIPLPSHRPVPDDPRPGPRRRFPQLRGPGGEEAAVGKVDATGYAERPAYQTKVELTVLR